MTILPRTSQTIGPLIAVPLTLVGTALIAFLVFASSYLSA
jgi:hypothetical protein